LLTILFDEQPAGAADRTYNVLTPNQSHLRSEQHHLHRAVNSNTNDSKLRQKHCRVTFPRQAIVRNGIARLNVDGSVTAASIPVRALMGLSAPS